MNAKLGLAAFSFVGTLLLSVPAIAADVDGTASATFENPTPSGPPIVTTGTSTNAFTYGADAGVGTGPNSLSFAGSAFSSAFETPFKVGTLTYFNGTTVLDKAPSAVDLALTTNFTNPAIGNILNSFTLSLVITPNGNIDPDADADFVNLPGSLTPNIFPILGVNYTVKLTGFGNVHGDGFLASSGTQLHVREGLSATADLFAEVTTDTSPVLQGNVPEPSTWAMMILGFACVGFLAYRRRNQTPSLRVA